MPSAAPVHAGRRLRPDSAGGGLAGARNSNIIGTGDFAATRDEKSDGSSSAHEEAARASADACTRAVCVWDRASGFLKVAGIDAAPDAADAAAPAAIRATAVAMEASAALTSLGADLSVSISFVVANELVAGARELQVGDDELVAMLVAFVVVISSAQRGLKSISGDGDENSSHRRGMLDFVLLLLSIAQRIGLSIAVQLLAMSVRATAPSRLARVLTLLSAVVFFLFFESATSRRITA